ncbi:MAG: Holliday junction branch migration protein RuvA [Gammaproteobacteria bacterium]|nr:Holliday junction branch migration protein RuvA [Gammaproteobacteria bacterium]
MIGRLKGEIIYKKPPQLLIDVNGVGYEVEAPMTTFYDLPEAGQNAILLTHMVVREDAQLLYGFSTDGEREMFRQLIKINGVGPKLALTILSGISSAELARCVSDHDVISLVKLPGVGKKTAERLIIELADKLKLFPQAEKTSSGLAGEPVIVRENPLVEAESALVSLGYKAQEAVKMIKAVDAKGLSSEQIIRQALQAAVSGK